MSHVAVGNAVASHCSGEAPTERTRPSPQMANWQKPPDAGLTQLSVLDVLPSSHCSPEFTTLLPQIAPVQTLSAFAGVVQVNPGVVPDSNTHVLEQPSPFPVLPSSHASGAAGLRRPSPQTRVVQSMSHVAVGKADASHCSPAFTTPFPHAEPTHVLGEPSAAVQVNPASTTHVIEHPSPFTALPSSHASTRALFRLPSYRLSPQYEQRNPPLLMQVVFAEVVVDGTLLQLFALPVAGGAIGVPFASVEQPLQCVSFGKEISTSQPSATVELQSRKDPLHDNTQLLPAQADAEYVAPALLHNSPLVPHWH